MVLSQISTRSLVMTAVGGAFIVTGFGLYTKDRIARSIGTKPYYQEAIKLARRNEGIKTLVGMPFIDKKIDLSDRVSNFESENEAKFRVPCKGPRGKGNLHINAKKNGNWSLTRCEFELLETNIQVPDYYLNKKFVVYDSANPDAHKPDRRL